VQRGLKAEKGGMRDEGKNHEEKDESQRRRMLRQVLRLKEDKDMTPSKKTAKKSKSRCKPRC